MRIMTPVPSASSPRSMALAATAARGCKPDDASPALDQLDGSFGLDEVAPNEHLGWAARSLSRRALASYRTE